MKTKVFILVLLLCALHAVAQQPVCILERKNVNAFTRVEPPSIYKDRIALGKTQTITININYKNTFPDSAKTAIQEAVNIWSHLINSNQTITIDAYWSNLTESAYENALAFASPTSYRKNFNGALVQNAWYPIALAEKLSGQNLNNDSSEIKIVFNSKYSWYYGTDGYPPENKDDLITTALHELGHGLGISSSFWFDDIDNIGNFGYDSTSTFIGKKRYDDFCVKGQPGIPLTSFTNGSFSLGNALTSNDIFFNGDATQQMNNLNSAKLFAPTTWKGGSSISHLDDDTYPEGNSNSLMTHQASIAEAIHSPGEIGLAMLEDLGWTVNRVITVISPTNKTVVTKGQPFWIKWTDNKNGYVTITLYTKDSFGNYNVNIATIQSNAPSNTGKDSILWNVSGSLTDGDYKLKFTYGENSFSFSNAFKINNTTQVAMPEFNPPTGTFTVGSTEYIQITCSTSNAQIRYNINSPVEPDSNSTLYQNAIPVTTNTTIKAKAFKSGNSPSELATATYTFTNNHYTQFKQIDDQNITFDSVSLWGNGSAWIKFPSNNYFFSANGNLFRARASQTFKPGTQQKFNVWTRNNAVSTYLNHASIQTTLGQNNIVEGRFKSTTNATIQNQVEGMLTVGDSIGFKDPWLVDFNESPYGMRNRGMSALFISKLSPFYIDGNSVGNSLFLSQRPEVEGIYYSIRAKNSIIWNGNAATFLGWNYDPAKIDLQQVGSNPSGYNQKAVVFKQAGATATANYKAQLATNVSTNFTNSGQRKIVRTSDGALHLFYESIGKVWYEQSTNGGASWCQPFSVDDIVGKLSSVCTYGSDIVLAYQKNIDGNAVIQIEKFTPYPGVIQQNSVNNQITTSAAYSSEITPAIISNDNDLLLVSWQENNYVKYQFFWITGSAITLPTQSPSGGTIGTVNTFTPAVAVTPGTGWPKVFHTAFEKRTATSSNIVYRTISVLSSSFKVTISTPTGLSSGSGYTWNYRPSIIAASGDIARVNWIGQRLNPSDPDIQENVSLLKISNGSSFWAYGNTLVTSTQINKSNNGFLLAYSNNGTIYHKNHNNYNSQPNPTISGISGGTVQVAEGLSNNSFYVAALNTTQQPYRFNVGSITLSKEQSHNIAIGRSGVIVQDDAEFYFVLGDISVDGEPVDFVSFHDSLKFPTVSDLNSVLTTQPFHLTNNSQFFYSVQYGTTDSINAVALFSDAKSASFKVELIDDQTNQVLGSYDQIAFNANNPTQYNNLAYQVNTEGIGNRTVRLRLVASYNGLDPAFGVTNRQATESVMGKRQEKQIKNISFKGSAAITEYALEQNYPNPFNPSTTINYALPKSGFVTLKVYDVLGREVATLVNDHKETGRYSVQFDGSKLSSGTYIYKLTAEKFSDVKKFVLVK